MSLPDWQTGLTILAAPEVRQRQVFLRYDLMDERTRRKSSLVSGPVRCPSARAVRPGVRVAAPPSHDSAAGTAVGDLMPVPDA